MTTKMTTMMRLGDEKHKHRFLLVHKHRKSYTCDGCKEPGLGSRYICAKHERDYALHKDCFSTLVDKETIPTPFHPESGVCVFFRDPFPNRLWMKSTVDTMKDTMLGALDEINSGRSGAVVAVGKKETKISKMFRRLKMIAKIAVSLVLAALVGDPTTFVAGLIASVLSA